MLAAMTPRERFHAVMSFKPFDRLPIMEWATWWDKTLERWYSEGLDPAVRDRYDLYRHLGMDVYYQDWFSVQTPDCPRPASHGASIMKGGADYDELRRYLYPAHAVDKAQWEKWAAEQETGEAVLWFTVDGFFWFARTLFGIEPHMYAFYDYPDLLHRINQDLTDWVCRMIDEVCTVCTPDFMTFAEDMSYNHGPMLSKGLFDEFMRPYYEQVIPKLEEKGILPIIDSDGDITTAADWFAEAGLAGILPLERQAGVDVEVVRQKHPNMRFIGCYDKMVMNQGEAAMRAEFERLLPTAGQGGLIVSCDHQTPPGVSFSEYELYLQLFQEYAEKAGKLSQQ